MITAMNPGPLTDEFGRSLLHDVEKSRVRAWAANRLAGVALAQVWAIAAADRAQVPDIGVTGPAQWAALIAEARRLAATIGAT